MQYIPNPFSYLYYIDQGKKIFKIYEFHERVNLYFVQTTESYRYEMVYLTATQIFNQCRMDFAPINHLKKNSSKYKRKWDQTIHDLENGRPASNSCLSLITNFSIMNNHQSLSESRGSKTSVYRIWYLSMTKTKHKKLAPTLHRAIPLLELHIIV